MTKVETIKKLEQQLAGEREAVKTQLLVDAADILRQLEDIGFHYELKGKDEAKKLGRPRKEVGGGKEEGKQQRETGSAAA